MAGEPPPTPPAPPARPVPPGEIDARRERRQNRWLVVAITIALLAAGGAGYAISEIENTKDENRDDDRAVSELRAELEVLREQTTERLDTLEGRVDDAASAASQKRLENDFEDLDQRVKRLDRQGGSDDGLARRLDDLEQQVEDLQRESN